MFWSHFNCTAHSDKPSASRRRVVLFASLDRATLEDLGLDRAMTVHLAARECRQPSTVTDHWKGF